MSVEDAVAALLLLSSSFKSDPFSMHRSCMLQPPQIFKDSDKENIEQPPNYRYKPQPISRQTSAKRHLSPVQCENRKQRRLNDSNVLECNNQMSPELNKFQRLRIATTPTSSIHRLLPAANFFRPITPKPTFYDENYEHNYAAFDRSHDTLLSVSPTLSEISQSSTIDDTRRHYLANPIVQQWEEGELSSGLVKEAKIEFEKIVRDSTFAKDEYTSSQIAAQPIEFDYNPNKSHVRNYYLKPSEEETRMKNNLASRRSRHKKKLSVQIKSFNLDFDRTENRSLYAQEQWMAAIVASLEEKILEHGCDINELKALRTKCGFK